MSLERDRTNAHSGYQLPSPPASTSKTADSPSIQDVLATPKASNYPSHFLEAFSTPQLNGHQTPAQTPASQYQAAFDTSPTLTREASHNLQRPDFHVNHFAQTPRLPLPPIDPSKRLSSSPDPSIVTPTSQSLAQHKQANMANPQVETPPPTRGSWNTRMGQGYSHSQMQDDNGGDQQLLGPWLANTTPTVSFPSSYGTPLADPPAFSAQSSQYGYQVPQQQQEFAQYLHQQYGAAGPVTAPMYNAAPPSWDPFSDPMKMDVDASHASSAASFRPATSLGYTQQAPPSQNFASFQPSGNTSITDLQASGPNAQYWATSTFSQPPMYTNATAMDTSSYASTGLSFDTSSMSLSQTQQTSAAPSLRRYASVSSGRTPKWARVTAADVNQPTPTTMDPSMMFSYDSAAMVDPAATQQSFAQSSENSTSDQRVPYEEQMKEARRQARERIKQTSPLRRDDYITPQKPLPLSSATAPHLGLSRSKTDSGTRRKRSSLGGSELPIIRTDSPLKRNKRSSMISIAESVGSVSSAGTTLAVDESGHAAIVRSDSRGGKPMSSYRSRYPGLWDEDSDTEESPATATSRFSNGSPKMLTAKPVTPVETDAQTDLIRMRQRRRESGGGWSRSRTDGLPIVEANEPTFGGPLPIGRGPQNPLDMRIWRG